LLLTEQLALAMQQHTKPVRLNEFVSAARRLALVRCGVCQEEVERDMRLGGDPELWADVYHVIDNDRRVSRERDREGIDCWRWEGQKYVL
jgi:hypothetical protein